MESISFGFIILLNGLLAIIETIISPISLAVLVSAFAFLWLAKCEIDELDRLGSKPEVRRH
jgi:hypothetical protein